MILDNFYCVLCDSVHAANAWGNGKNNKRYRQPGRAVMVGKDGCLRCAKIIIATPRDAHVFSSLARGKIRRACLAKFTELDRKNALPANLSRPVGAVLQTLQEVVKEVVTGRVDLKTVDILIAEPLEVPALEPKRARTAMKKTLGRYRLSGNTAFFEWDADQEAYFMTVLVLLEPSVDESDKELLLDLLPVAYNEAGLAAPRYDTRGSNIKMSGARVAPNGGFGRYSKGREVKTDCGIVGSLLASLAAVIFIKRSLAGALCSSVFSALSVGGNYWASLLPFHIAAMSLNYENDAHIDARDFGHSFIFWMNDCDDVEGGEFVIDSYGIDFIPRQCSIIYIAAQRVAHHTEPVTSSGSGKGRYGVAFAFNKAAATGFENYAKKFETREEMLADAAGEDEQLLLDVTKLSQNLRNNKAVKNAFERYKKAGCVGLYAKKAVRFSST